MESLHIFKLLEIKQETSDVKSFIFTPLDPGFTWSAGQYLDWQLPHPSPDDRGERRWFSIASAPSEKHVLLSTRFSDNGSTLKQKLLSLEVGDEVQAKGPMGSFTADSNTQRLVLIAGGIGITPFRSILVERAAQHTLKNIVLVYGNKSPENVPFKDDLDMIAAQNSGLMLEYVYGQHIDATTLKNSLGLLESSIFMISGLEKMVIAIKESLFAAGVPEDHIRIDDFGGYDEKLGAAVYS